MSEIRPPADQQGDLAESRSPFRTEGALFYAKLVGIPVGLGVLIYALADIGLGGRALGAPWALPGAVGLFLVAAVLAGVRLAVTFRAGGEALGVSRAVDMQFRAMFYHLFVPFGFGQDMAKFAMLRKSWTRGKVALATVLLFDRVIGVASFALLSAVTGVWVFKDMIWLVWGGAVVLGILAVGLGGGWLARILPDKYAHQVQDVHALVLARPGYTAAALAMTLVLHVIMGLSVWLAAVAWGIPLSRVEAVFASSSAFLFQVIPMQVAGAGGAEAAGMVIYTLLGLGAAQAALLVTVAYGLRIVAALVGGLLDARTLLRRGRTPPAP